MDKGKKLSLIAGAMSELEAFAPKQQLVIQKSLKRPVSFAWIRLATTVEVDRQTAHKP